MFAAGANGIAVDFSQTQCVRQPLWSIKKQESLIKNGNLDLVDTILRCGFDFVTTHIYQPLTKTKLAVISIIISDAHAVETTVLRQMSLQVLSIEVNANETAYRLIKSAVDQRRWYTAAKTWFAMARTQWMNDLQCRIRNPLPGCTVLHFDRLYHDDFVDSLRQQGFGINLDQIKHNHEHWLRNNLDHTLDSTLRSMAMKLERMDWNRLDRVTYDQS
jgi:hypothetical protein